MEHGRNEFSIVNVPVGLRYPHARQVSYFTPVSFQIFAAITTYTPFHHVTYFVYHFISHFTDEPNVP